MTEHTNHPGLNLGAGHASAEKSAERLMFGFWVFLMSDLITFGLLFAVYGTTLNSTAGGPGPKDVINLTSVILQTAALLLSSFTCGMTSLALKHQHGDHHNYSRRTLLLWLAITLVLGATFIALEVNDFIAMANDQALPSRSGWLSAYWLLIGVHGFHMVVGCIFGLTIGIQILTQGVSDPVKLRLMRWSLYWHFLDIIWVGIFSVVFLGGLL